MKFTVRGGKVIVNSLLSSVRIGGYVEVYKEYQTRKGVSYSTPCAKVVRQQNRRPYISYDGDQIFLDRPDPEMFLGDIFNKTDELLEFLSYDVCAAAMADKDEALIVMEDAVYKISGLCLASSPTGASLILTPLKKWKNFKNELVIDMVKLFLKVKEEKWDIVYLGELGSHPYAAAENLR